MDSRPLVWLAPDCYNWALHRVALGIASGIGDRYRMHVGVGAPPAPEGRVDLFVELYWPAFHKRRAECNPRRAVVGSFSFSQPSPDILLACDALAVSGAMRLEMYQQEYGTRVATYLCEDGVDCDEFTPTPLPETFTVGWTGCAETGKRLDLVQRACEIAGVSLTVWQRKEEWRPFASMPDFYRSVSVYVCASDSEGTPLPVLEAMACGRPVVSTRCGIVPKLVHHGINGLLVDQHFSGWPGCPSPRVTTEALAEAIAQMRETPRERLAAMGAAARRTAEANTWKAKVPLGWGVLFADMLAWSGLHHRG